MLSTPGTVFQRASFLQLTAPCSFPPKLLLLALSNHHAQVGLQPITEVRTVELPRKVFFFQLQLTKENIAKAQRTRGLSSYLKFKHKS